MRPMKFSALANGVIALTGFIGVAAAIAYYLSDVQGIGVLQIVLLESAYITTVLVFVYAFGRSL